MIHLLIGFFLVLYILMVLSNMSTGSSQPKARVKTEWEKIKDEWARQEAAEKHRQAMKDYNLYQYEED